MIEFWSHLFDTSDFPPRWNCGHWTEGHGWLHILSDVGIWSAYFAIPVMLAYFMVRRKDLPFRKVFLLFAAFILLCGATHLMEAIIFWWPAYRLAGVIKLATAMVSWVTVVALVGVVPSFLRMRSPEELEREIVARKRAEDNLQQTNAALEQRVQARTSELAASNTVLQSEREWFRITLASIGDAVITTDLDGKVTLLNSVAEELTGWTQKEAAGQDLATIFRIVNDATRLPVPNPASRALAEGMVVGLANHTLLIAKDGAERFIDDSASPIKNEAGEIIGAVLIFRDISERYQSDQALREGGRIGLTAERRGGQVMLAVSDTGIGIPADMVDHVFQMFTQIERDVEKGYTGLGIGLTLVKSLVTMHGGSIEVHSGGENQGSEFRVFLPMVEDAPPGLIATPVILSRTSSGCCH